MELRQLEKTLRSLDRKEIQPVPFCDISPLKLTDAERELQNFVTDDAIEVDTDTDTTPDGELRIVRSW